MINTVGSVASSFLKRAQLLDIVLLLMFFEFGILPAADAYLDPGTGSFVLQTLVAALFGALFVLKSFWVRIKNWLFGRDDEGSNSSGKNSVETNAIKTESSETNVKSSQAEEPEVKSDES